MTVYWDEKILDAWNDIQKRREIKEVEEKMAQMSPEEWLAGVQLGVIEYEGQTIYCEEKLFFDEQMAIHLPTSMWLIPRGIESKGNTTHQHDQMTYKNEKGTVMFGLTHMTHLIQMDDVEQFLSTMTIQLKKKQAGLQVVHNEVIELSEVKVASSEFVIPLKNGKYYQILFVTALKERMLLGSFHFAADEVIVWQPLARALIRTMRLV
ncbi:hypothetical protein HPY27_12515 [Brevibacillus sp. HB1.1]|uniref:hypothetical protein n=1 Tax=Brevibacillus sp. HB1.1 TaxID=2738808 RepID=UPI00036C85AD|nr:hypothetical protein [Brevibacillus sp. HB1.1]ATF11539.1 hypothetical protein A616_05865 [Brevibacillus brevis X23]NTU30970.1 hypothetical protein [Brevibacillus sp. HB1.1]